jgi:hypothetical protein
MTASIANAAMAMKEIQTSELAVCSEVVESAGRQTAIPTCEGEGTSTCPCTDADVLSEAHVSEEDVSPTETSIGQWFRKAGVAVAGGTMVGVGLIMIPLPTPFGAVVAGSGMAVLGMEFPAAQRVLDQTCNKVADVIERSSRDDPQEGDEIKAYANEKMRDLVQEQKRRDTAITHNLKQLGKKVVPVIRKIGDGIDKEQLERTSENVARAAIDAKVAVQLHIRKFWKRLLVFDENDDASESFQEPNQQRS